MSAVKCTHCQLPCYPLEKMVLGEKPYHRGCAKCSHCQSTLSLASFSISNGNLYCKPHFMELFKSTGGKYAFPEPVGAAATVEQVQEFPVKPQLRAVKKLAAAAPMPSPKQQETVVLRTVAVKPAEFTKEEPAPKRIAMVDQTKPSNGAGNRLGQFLQQSSAVATQQQSTQQAQTPASNKSKLAAFLATTSAKPAIVEAAKPAIVEAAKPAIVEAAKPAIVEAANPAIVEATKPAIVEAARPAIESIHKPVMTQKPANVTNNNNKDLEAKVKLYEAKIQELELECKALRGRVSMLDTSKEYLVQENARLDNLLNCLTTKSTVEEIENRSAAQVQTANSALELSWARAKKLLRAGKITQDQHDAACRAALEASRAYSQNPM